MSSLLLLLFLGFFTFTFGIPAWYYATRNEILARERADRTGGDKVLNAMEYEVSKMLVAEKKKVIEDARLNGTIFPPAVSFFQSKPIIDKSKVYQFLKKMPKGGALHLHTSSTVSLEWLIKNVTYRPHCYICYENTGAFKFHFFDTPPINKECPWNEVKVVRQNAGDADEFDKNLIKNLTIVVDDPERAYPTINDVWTKFNTYFSAVSGLVKYAPVVKDYFTRSLEEFYADNVMYMEVRFSSYGYELNGTKHGAEWVLDNYKKLIHDFKMKHSDFLGAKFIYSGLRFSTAHDVLIGVEESIALLQRYPDIFVGYDLVQQEDLGHTQQYFLDSLLYPEEQHENLPYFFHAGETDLQGGIDLNLLDAVLLNTSRIGHGFALLKHPEVMSLARNKSIAVEVNPISNQVLHLVSDLRNHPAAVLIANNYPVVISSDDPAVWFADPLSHDFYVTFMALTSEEADLGVLKQLAKNSITYSAMTDTEKQFAITQWQNQWDKFIAETYAKIKNLLVPFG